ncbi:MAG: 1-acyl-sn-glycerol-3-phosphate acyltransferase [Oscillospiraceae bacterium]|nr:1-acyl-sn-glycerol-3-phosphate acyltransferase [Oscillospiraceae bacterium]
MLFYVYLTLGILCGLSALVFCPVAPTLAGWFIAPLVAFVMALGFVLLHLLVLVIAALSLDLEKPFYERSKAYRRFVEVSLRAIAPLCGVRMHVTGFDKLPTDRRYFFTCNHRSNFDPLLTLALLSKKQETVFVSKAENNKIPFFGSLMSGYGTLTLVREDDRSGVKMVIDAIKIIKENRGSIAIYPEGWSNLTREVLLPLRAGAFKVPLKTKAPIAVATIQNTRHIARRILLGGTDVYLDVLRVIEPEEYEGLSTNELADMVSSIMKANLENPAPDRKIFKNQVPDKK